MRTAESGYMTRRLVDSAQEVIVREEDCGTQDSIIITREEAKIRGEGFDDLIFGRAAAEDIVDENGVVLVPKNGIIGKKLRDIVMASTVDTVKVRSPLTCGTVSGVCQKCFGMDLSTRTDVEIGSPV